MSKATPSHNTTLVIDDFFSNPDELREYTLTENFRWTKKFWHPGTRTECLSLYDYPLYDSLCKIFIGAYFPETLYKDISIKWEAGCFFHYAVEGDNERELMANKKKRLHVDHDALCSAIVYLTPNPDPESGTTTYFENENGEAVQDMNIGNRYNRMLLFPSGQVLHGVNKMFGTCKEDGRLQLLFFLYNISYDLT